MYLRLALVKRTLRIKLFFLAVLPVLIYLGYQWNFVINQGFAEESRSEYFLFRYVKSLKKLLLSFSSDIDLADIETATRDIVNSKIVHSPLVHPKIALNTVKYSEIHNCIHMPGTNDSQFQKLSIRKNNKEPVNENKPLVFEDLTDKFISTWCYDVVPSEKDYQTVRKAELTANNSAITLVTSYFNIGSFYKGNHFTIFKPSYYHAWMRAFKWITNPVVAYVEEDEDVQELLALRSFMPSHKTKIYKISRSQLWAFRTVKSTIASIFNNDSLPKNRPNRPSEIPEYSCIMHSKYELVYRTVLLNPFHTRYFAWLDIGLFREIAETQTNAFHLELPPRFDKNKVAYNEVYQFMSVPVDRVAQIFYHNSVWVCGCFFVARATVMIKWTREYKRYLEHFLSIKLANTDQQVLYAMFNNEDKPGIGIQTYKGDGRYDNWFHLAYVCAENSRNNANLTRPIY